MGTLMASSVEECGSPVEGFGCAWRHHSGHGLELRGVWAAASCLCDASEGNGEVVDAVYAEINRSTRALSMAAAAATDGAAARERGRGAAGGRGLCTQGLKATYIGRRRERTSRWCSSASLPLMVGHTWHGSGSHL